MARKRGLSSEDKALWDRVTQSVARMHPAQRQELPAPPPTTPKPQPRDSLPAAPVMRNLPVLSPAPARLGSFDPAPTPAQHLLGQPLRMDHKTHRQMNQGKLRPEARLDLHGMTLAVAHPALIGFLLTAHSRGHRLVLVITGKGKPGSPDAPLPTRPGALRHSVPHWLDIPPLSQIVLQAKPAHRKHGGEGAYYVYLRKSGVRP